MKTKKIISIGAVIIFLLSMVLVSACGNKTASYTGKWELTTLKGGPDGDIDAKEIGFEMAFELQEDGKGKAFSDGNATDIEYIIDGDAITITLEDEVLKGIISEKEMIFEDEEFGDTMVFNKVE